MADMFLKQSLEQFGAKRFMVPLRSRGKRKSKEKEGLVDAEQSPKRKNKKPTFLSPVLVNFCLFIREIRNIRSQVSERDLKKYIKQERFFLCCRFGLDSFRTG